MLTTTCEVRCIDDLGRISIPKDIRRSLKIKEKDEFAICVADKNIVLVPVKQPSLRDEVLKLAEKFQKAGNPRFEIFITELLKIAEELEEIL